MPVESLLGSSRSPPVLTDTEILDPSASMRVTPMVCTPSALLRASSIVVPSGRLSLVQDSQFSGGLRTRRGGTAQSLSAPVARLRSPDPSSVSASAQARLILPFRSGSTDCPSWRAWYQALAASSQVDFPIFGPSNQSNVMTT